ncbi:MAG: hypothetical protein WD555_01340 [Fulvivirga sp.]
MTIREGKKEDLPQVLALIKELAVYVKAIQKGKGGGCTGMAWQVLEWNEPAINFYKKYYDADLDSTLLNCSITF